MLLGHVAETPVYIDADQDARWGRPAIHIAVAPGQAMGLSLEGLHDVHFVNRPPAGPPAAGATPRVSRSPIGKRP